MKLSIIIPVYNTPRDLLQGCLSSIKQNVREVGDNVEVLLINDGSTEPYIEKMLKETEQEDSHFKYIFKQNGGVSDARNLGISKAKSEYITFVDSDDYLEPNAIAYMMDVVDKTQADMAIFGFLKDEDRYEIDHCRWMLSQEEKTKLHNCLISYVDDSYYLQRGLFLYACWGRLFRKSIIQKYNIQFDINLVFSEDSLFNFCYITFIDKVYVDNKPLYHYISNQESATINFTFRKGINLPILLKTWEKFILEHFPGQRDKLESLGMRTLEEIRGVRYQYFTHPQNKKSFWQLRSEMSSFFSIPPIKRWIKVLRISDARDIVVLKNILLLKLHLYWIYLITERNERRNNFNLQ